MGSDLYKFTASNSQFQECDRYFRARSLLSVLEIALFMHCGAHPLRVEFIDALYHITSRGIYHQM